MKIDEMIKQGIRKLQGFSFTPEIDASVLAKYSLEITDTELIMNYNVNTTPDKEFFFFDNIEKRIEGTPIAYITGQKEFWGLNFIVNQHTLVPRCDSETIIEALLSIYKNKEENLRIGDFGTGTCCLLISLLYEYKNALGLGIEKSRDAFLVSSRNVTLHNLENRIHLINSDWSYINPKVLPEQFNNNLDVIVCNPPYIKGPITSKFEPKLALDGGLDGLDHYYITSQIAYTLLKQDGILIYEVGLHQHLEVKNIATKHGYEFIDFFKDISNINRVAAFVKRL